MEEGGDVASRTHITISEYQSFTCGTKRYGAGFFPLEEKAFNYLESFVLANRSATDTDPLELMVISSRCGVGKIISAKNYVGLITLKDGTEIEILPKIYSPQADNQAAVRKLFIKMLQSVRDVPYKVFDVSKLKTESMNVFEIFIRMFIDEVFSIVKRGLKASYITRCDNERFYKGKLIFSQHIKENYVHKERVFIEYDIFSTNRPENRLIKSTLEFLQKHTTSIRNRKDLSVLLASFDGVNFSNNYEQDFTQYVKNRNMTEYDAIMRWCRVFLQNKSFTSFAGSEVAYAILFPMEQIFESYVAAKLGKALGNNQYSMKTQDKSYHLFDHPSKKFALRPDIVVTKKTSKKVTVLDTKWKLLSPSYHNYGIAQSDMYQMYAYQKKYEASQVILIYPMNENIKDLCSDISYKSEDGVSVKAVFLDLMDMDSSIAAVKTLIACS